MVQLLEFKKIIKKKVLSSIPPLNTFELSCLGLYMYLYFSYIVLDFSDSSFSGSSEK